jgi:homoserine dehydrogenase
MRIVLVGFGTVGQNLAKIIESKSRQLLSDYGFHPRIVAVVDRAGAMIDPKGLDLNRILEVKHAKGSVAHDSELGQLGMNGQEVIESVESESVLELTPTRIKDGEPGLSHIRTALRN